MTDQRGGPLSVDVDMTGAFVVHGDIDIAGGPTLERYVGRSQDGLPIVLDLHDVEFIDSSGLRTLLSHEHVGLASTTRTCACVTSELLCVACWRSPARPSSSRSRNDI